jgi:hypothetical protein
MNDFIAIDRCDSIDATVVIISGNRMKCISAKSVRASAYARIGIGKCPFAQKGEPLPALKRSPFGLLVRAQLGPLNFSVPRTPDIDR